MLSRRYFHTKRLPFDKNIVTLRTTMSLNYWVTKNLVKNAYDDKRKLEEIQMVVARCHTV